MGGITVWYSGSDYITRYHEARHSSVGSTWRREAYLRPHLRGDARRPEGVPGERDPRRSDVHGTRQEEDGDGHGCGVRPEEAGTYPVRIWRLDCIVSFGADNINRQ